MKRNIDRINSMGHYLVTNASATHGRTVSEIVESTGINRTAVQNILKEPGFCKSLSPRYPQGYYFDLTKANLSKIINTKRDYYKRVDIVGPLVAFTGLFRQPYYSNMLAVVNQFIESSEIVIQNVDEFTRNESSLKIELAEKMQKDAKDVIYSLETMIRVVEKQLKVDLENPEWWTNYAERMQREVETNDLG